MRPRSKGFTLVELMIVVGIMAILAALVYPSYVREVVKTKRAKGAACLMEDAQFMERYYSTSIASGYKGADTAFPVTPCSTELKDDYDIALVATPTETTYTLAATPKNRQADKDKLCGTMSINQAGKKEITGNGAISDCF